MAMSVFCHYGDPQMGQVAMVSLWRPTEAPGAPDKCCFTFQTSRIKKGNILGWYLTSPECSYPAMVFKTRIGKEICANPDKRWVQKYQGFFQPHSLSVPN
ncbi:unnamed protein product [Caretta caretta]